MFPLPILFLWRFRNRQVVKLLIGHVLAKFDHSRKIEEVGNGCQLSPPIRRQQSIHGPRIQSEEVGNRTHPRFQNRPNCKKNSHRSLKSPVSPDTLALAAFFPFLFIFFSLVCQFNAWSSLHLTLHLTSSINHISIHPNILKLLQLHISVIPSRVRNLLEFFVSNLRLFFCCDHEKKSVSILTNPIRLI